MVLVVLAQRIRVLLAVLEVTQLNCRRVVVVVLVLLAVMFRELLAVMAVQA